MLILLVLPALYSRFSRARVEALPNRDAAKFVPNRAAE
jgi:hypothetical protein